MGNRPSRHKHWDDPLVWIRSDRVRVAAAIDYDGNSIKLGKVLRCSQRAAHEWLSGAHERGRKSLRERMAEVFGVPEEWLAGETDHLPFVTPSAETIATGLVALLGGLDSAVRAYRRPQELPKLTKLLQRAGSYLDAVVLARTPSPLWQETSIEELRSAVKEAEHMAVAGGLPPKRARTVAEALRPVLSRLLPIRQRPPYARQAQEILLSRLLATAYGCWRRDHHISPETDHPEPDWNQGTASLSVRPPWDEWDRVRWSLEVLTKPAAWDRLGTPGLTPAVDNSLSLEATVQLYRQLHGTITRPLIPWFEGRSSLDVDRLTAIAEALWNGAPPRTGADPHSADT